MRTGLLWTARDAGRPLLWAEADTHCRSLGVGAEEAGWRLPSIDELAGLHDPSLEQACGEGATCRVDPAIRLSGPYVWSSTAPQPERRAYFDFALGSRLSPLLRPTLGRRVLCTRRVDP